MIRNFNIGKTVFQSDEVVGKLISNTGKCEFVQLNIGENKTIESHVLNVRVTFFIIQGNAELTVDDKKYTLAQGDLITVEPSSARGWINTGNQEFKLLAIKEL